MERKKHTAFLAEYLKDNYTLPDHRGESAFSLWDAEWYKLENKLLSLKINCCKKIGKNCRCRLISEENSMKLKGFLRYGVKKVLNARKYMPERDL